MSFYRLKKAVIDTLSYSDIFDYPLKEEEIGKYLFKIKNQSANWRIKNKNTIQNSKIINKREGYYFLKGRDKIVEMRKRRKKWSEEKLKKTGSVVNFLQLIPSIKLIGITGALAMENAKKSDDIDLLIITKGRLLWTTRFLATLLLDLIGVRRQPGEKNINNKICLNMFLEEEHLKIPEKEKDIFSAHEVVQMKPVFERDGTYYKFIKANLWVKKFLPNSLEDINYQSADLRTKIKNTYQKSNIFMTFLIFICNFTFYFLLFALMEKFFRSFQLWYMQKRRTTEVIKESIIRFHPKDARVWVLKEYKNKINSFIDY